MNKNTDRRCLDLAQLNHSLLRFPHCLAQLGHLGLESSLLCLEFFILLQVETLHVVIKVICLDSHLLEQGVLTLASIAVEERFYELPRHLHTSEVLLNGLDVIVFLLRDKVHGCKSLFAGKILRLTLCSFHHWDYLSIELCAQGIILNNLLASLLVHFRRHLHLFKKCVAEDL